MVQDALVVAVTTPAGNHKIMAGVVKTPGAELDAKTLGQFCRTQLATHKVPTVWQFCETLPKTASGKPIRRLLAASFPTDQTG
jgi:long-chain acyl-CoA synthetase